MKERKKQGSELIKGKEEEIDSKGTTEKEKRKERRKGRNIERNKGVHRERDK